LERITAVSDVPRFLGAAHRISLQTWQSRQFGLRVRNNDEERELLTILASEGLLRSYLWYSNGEPIAFTVGNQDKGCFHYEEVGYMTSHARYSPGQMMLVQLIDDLLTTNRPDWFDFGGGDADYKQIFANHESRSGTLWLWPPTWSNVATVNYIRGCRRLRHGVRRAVVNSGLATRARQWVRYGWNRVAGKGTPAVTTPNTDAGAE
ncbi:MAG TPA: GNAT family N-acetyltransferase, partial [Planctomycetaceae bacterium]|nr:GNAT family N-acetyltransferase [Planctomycetaceae bacterium]